MPVGLRRRVGLLLEVGEPMPSREGRLMGSSAPDKELDEEFKRKERRSKRDPPASVPGSPSFLCPILMRSFESPVSGSEPVRKSG